MAETRTGFAFENPNHKANDGWGEILSADELRYVYAFGSPLVAPDGQTIPDTTLRWYINNAIGWVERDLDYSLMKKQWRHRPPKHLIPRDDFADLDALSLKYEPGAGAGTAATIQVAGGVLSTTITGEAGDNLSIDLADYSSMWRLVEAITSVSTTGTYTAVLVGRQDVTPTQLKDVTATDLFNVAATVQATAEEFVDFYWDDAYDYDRTQYQNFVYIKLNHGPVISVQSVEFRDPTGGLIIDLTEDCKPNFDMGSIEFYPSHGLISAFPQFYTPYGHRLLTGAYGEAFPDAFFIDYQTGFPSAKAARHRVPELFEVVGKLAAINLLADYGDGRTAALASSSVGLSGLSESISTTLSATSAMFGARIKQYYEDLKRFYDQNKNKYRGILLAAL